MLLIYQLDKLILFPGMDNLPDSKNHVNFWSCETAEYTIDAVHVLFHDKIDRYQDSSGDIRNWVWFSYFPFPFKVPFFVTE